MSLSSGALKHIKRQILNLSRNYQYVCILDSHSQLYGNIQKIQTEYDLIAGFGNPKKCVTIQDYQKLKTINKKNNKWLLGYLSYDLKNRFENLSSNNPENIDWPDVFLFEPELLILIRENEITLESKQTSVSINQLLEPALDKNNIVIPSLNLSQKLSREEYLFHVKAIQEYIKKGYIYEINFCHEFFEQKKIDPYEYFWYLTINNPSPFSAFVRLNDKFLISASPERFLKKSGSTIISQPIKGTSPRGKSISEDQKHKNKLQNSEKERSENIMIVDLVRNDLSRIAKPKTVQVDELCEIYTYPHVHQMISTISAELRDLNLYDILKATFPMGSMTGAPKVEAMLIIEEHEDIKRGLYSGSVGYITPEMNFDFNVVIRSLQYQETKSYISYMVGSAITSLAIPEQEYEECLLKVYGFNQKIKHKDYAQKI